MRRSGSALRKPGFLALVCLGLAYVSLAQGIGWNQLAHYSLVRALADRTPVVDPYRHEGGTSHGSRGTTTSPRLPAWPS